MLNYQKRKRRWSLVKAMIILVAVMLVLVLLDMKIRPAVKTMAAYQAKLFAIQAINDAVADELAREQVDYNALAKVNLNQNGAVTSIESDMLTINRLKVGITDAVVQKLNKLESADLKIPLGTLLGGQIFSGRGPGVDFRIMHAGYMQSEISNQFLSAGINQTCHRIMLSISIHITAFVPGYAAATEVTTGMCLAETVVVGAVPEAFTEVTGDDGSTISKINDYSDNFTGSRRAK